MAEEGGRGRRQEVAPGPGNHLAWGARWRHKEREGNHRDTETQRSGEEHDNLSTVAHATLDHSLREFSFCWAEIEAGQVVDAFGVELAFVDEGGGPELAAVGFGEEGGFGQTLVGLRGGFGEDEFAGVGHDEEILVGQAEEGAAEAG